MRRTAYQAAATCLLLGACNLPPGGDQGFAASPSPDSAGSLPRASDARSLPSADNQSEASLRAALATAASNLAANLLSQGRAKEALALLEPLSRGNADPQVLRTLGVALDMSGRQADAQAAYRRGIAVAPSDAKLHGNLALSLAISGDVDAALKSLQSNGATPRTGTAAANRVLLLAMAGREDEARQSAGNLQYAEADALLSRGRKARSATTPADRAAALGVVNATAQ